MKPACHWMFALAVLAGAQAASAAVVPPDHAARMQRGTDTFIKHVRSTLLDHCVKCHGGEKTQSEFDLTTREGLLRGGAEGSAIQLYDAKSSRLYRLIRHDEEPHMPAKAARLSDSMIAAIGAWIDDGAPYDEPLIARDSSLQRRGRGISDEDRQWWAFQPLRRVSPPAALAAESILTPVDAFVVAALGEKGTALNRRADRRTLIRRAFFDLIGMPPAPADMAAFLQDPSADAAAWARVVDRCLEDPRYGERWARHWLDVARFAESSGFEHDTDRPGAHHYRDFVIRALNMDMPFDQFVRWQIAGDEFEPNNPLALMATGFLGAGVFPTQITANEVERTRYDAMDDMLATTGTAMLGLTIGCARCHDHKFDPIPTRDYYRMLATFTTTVRSNLELDLDPEANRRAREAFEAQHAPLLAALRTYEANVLPAKFAHWLDAAAPKSRPPTWLLLESAEFKSEQGATFRPLGDGSFLVEGKNASSDAYTCVAQVGARRLTALRLEALADPSLPKGGPGRADNGNIGLSRVRVFLTPEDPDSRREVKLVRARATFEQDANSLSVASALDDKPKTGWAIDPNVGADQAAIFEFEKPLDLDAAAQLEIRLEFDVNARHNIGRPRLSVTTEAHPRFEGDPAPEQIVALIERLRRPELPGAWLNREERAALMSWWKLSESGWRALHDRVETHAQSAPKPRLTQVLICGEGYPALRMNTQGADFFKETHFLHRGSTELKRGIADPGFLQVLMRETAKEEQWRWTPPEGVRFSGRRRALANWLTDAEQGAGHLLARVIVNRLWQHHFGEGLVATANDFGTQGAKPSHPELLDWLAAELIGAGWRLKPIHRLLMTSGVYQQAVAADRGENQPGGIRRAAPSGLRLPRRLEAEVIRDSILSVAGILDPVMHGPGTLELSSRRRSIYFTVKRSRMIPVLQAFDAPEPLVSQGSRPVTTVAPQALWLLNSSEMRACAEAFAHRLAAASPSDFKSIVAQAYEIALNRAPTERELRDAIEFCNRQAVRYRSQQLPDALGRAAVDFAQVMLSLNEFVYVE